MAAAMSETKEVTLQLVEKLDSIVSKEGKLLSTDLSSELVCYSTL